ncbi:MAG TPA: DNA polymerase III subunit alpha, partial [Aeromicrobium sp.]|nr:DNA polymerase III subunit alpha [Aeromicrobium sp.]
DISAVIALYRPGPMGADSHTNYAKRKNGNQPIDYIHDELTEALKPILGTTYGLIVYQEQVMSIAQELAGYSLGQADNLRRAMGKKKKEVLEKEFEGFESGMLARGFSPAAVKKLWDILVPFADYAFNKAHSAAYGVISYWTAYLKAHYPAEYMAALLTSTKDKDQRPIYLSECRRMGIQVLVPDVNESQANFAPVGTDIRFGLTAVRNVGANVVTGIIAAREDDGAFTDFSDFLDKVPVSVCNKRVLDSLIKAGAFDSLGHQRRALAAIADESVDQYIDLKRNAAIGQDSLFGGLDDSFSGVSISIPVMPEWDKTQKLALEREMLGLYVSDHPLLGLEHVVRANSDSTIGQLIADSERADGSSVRLCGMVTAVVRKTTRRGDTWASVTVEDLEGAVTINVFPAVYQASMLVLALDRIVVVRARIKRNDEGLDLNAAEVTEALAGNAQSSGPLAVTIPVARCTGEVIAAFKGTLSAHPGVTEVHLRLVGTEGVKVMRLDESLRVDPSSSLISELKELLGPQCIA